MTSTKTSLAEQLDDYFRSLLAESQPGNLDESAPDGGSGELPVAFLDRLKLFEAGVKWVAVKNRIETAEETDAFGKLRSRFHKQRGPRGGSAPGATQNDGSAADPDPDA